MAFRLMRPRQKSMADGRRRRQLPHALALILAFGVVAGLFATATVVGGLVLRLGDTTFSPTLTRAVPYTLAIVVTLIVVVVAPLALDRGITAAFRRLQPDARGTPAQTFVVWNFLLLAAIVLLAPRATRGALERHGDWMVSGVLPEPVPTMVAKLSRWAASALPGEVGPGASTAPAAPAASATPSAEAAASAPPPAPVASASAAPEAPVASASAAPEPVASADAGPERDLGADEVFAARAGSVVQVFALYLGPDAPKGAARPLVGAGPGVVVGAEGLVLTFEPLVREATSAVVGLGPGRWSSPIEVLAADPARGLALIKVPAEGLAAAPLGDAAAIGVGARVVAVAAAPGLAPAMGEAVVGALREGPGGTLVQVRPLAADPVDGPIFDRRGRLAGLGPAKAEGRVLGPAAVSVKHVHELLARPRAPRRLEPWPETSGVEGLRLEGDELSAAERAQIGDAMKLWTAAVEACATQAGATAHLTLAIAAPAPGLDAGAAIAKAPPQITSGLGAEGERCVEKGLGPFHAAVVRALLRERNEGGGPTAPLTLSFQTNLSPREGETKPRTLLAHYVLKPRKAASAEPIP
ncbi:MAG TPA: trypsin-like peptidase domain-containing protein [Polyangiaceae bacterium]|nr:trypsin-like peptidase domain-containing protein [Polyangiaceae bacterium]